MPNLTPKKLNPPQWSIQIDIPSSVYGMGAFGAPYPISKWFAGHNLPLPILSHYSSTGDGYNDAGVSTQKSHVVVRNITDENLILLFKIQFPDCGVHVFEMYEDHAE